MFGGCLLQLCFVFIQHPQKGNIFYYKIKNKHKLLFQTLLHTFNLGLFINQPQASE